MKEGKETVVAAHIIGLPAATAQATQAANQALDQNLGPNASSSVNLQISTTMRVTLTGADEDFDIQRHSTEEQLVGDLATTEWVWTVVPKR
jgi:hypothetical protein